MAAESWPENRLQAILNPSRLCSARQMCIAHLLGLTGALLPQHFVARGLRVLPRSPHAAVVCSMVQLGPRWSTMARRGPTVESSPCVRIVIARPKPSRVCARQTRVPLTVNIDPDAKRFQSIYPPELPPCPPLSRNHERTLMVKNCPSFLRVHAGALRHASRM